MQKSEAAIELDEYNIMNRIDKSHQYFLGNPVKCAEKTATAKGSVDKCVYFSPKKMNDYDLLVMEYGGLNFKSSLRIGCINTHLKLRPRPSNTKK
jgi:hypothetical protein